MDKIDAVNKMQAYIDEHYMEVITMSDLAKVSFYSPWYSYRLFTQYTNMTISDYVRRLRLSKSAIELRDKNVKIIDIAYKYCYDSVDGYQRAFFKEFGMNPYEYSKNPVPIILFTPYKILKKKEIKEMDNVRNIFISIIEKPERKVLIKRGLKATEYWSYCLEVGCDVWGLLQSIKSISGEPVCLWLPEEYVKPNTSVYVQGVEVNVDYQGIIPEGFDVITLPKCKYLMFQGEPFEEENFEQAIMDVKNAMEKYNPEPLGYVYDSSNPHIQLEPIGSRGYIELLAVKEK